MSLKPTNTETGSQQRSGNHRSGAPCRSPVAALRGELPLRVSSLVPLLSVNSSGSSSSVVRSSLPSLSSFPSRWFSFEGSFPVSFLIKRGFLRQCHCIPSPSGSRRPSQRRAGPGGLCGPSTKIPPAIIGHVGPRRARPGRPRRAIRRAFELLRLSAISFQSKRIRPRIPLLGRSGTSRPWPRRQFCNQPSKAG